MTAPTWADPTKPLAERVRLMALDWDMTAATEAHREALLADVAAADRLARATDALDADDWSMVDEEGVPLVANVHIDALAAYRARKEVARG